MRAADLPRRAAPEHDGRVRFIGVDLTSAYAAAPREVDLAVLTADLRCTFARARWPGPAVVAARDPKAAWRMLVEPVGGGAPGDVWAIDGPHALAAPGERARACERALRAPGRTPDALPEPTSRRPYDAFLRSSIDLFAALLAAAPPGALGGAAPLERAILFEVFPGAAWRVLAGGAADPKGSAEGRGQRRTLLARAGVAGLPELPTADENDAAVAAYLAWCTRFAPRAVALAGTPPFEADGALREGCILHATSAASGAT